jgi:formylglycine-generating enzyme required for sulfatase activity
MNDGKQSGGVNAETDGDMSVGKNVVGRDNIENTTNITRIENSRVALYAIAGVVVVAITAIIAFALMRLPVVQSPAEAPTAISALSFRSTTTPVPAPPPTTSPTAIAALNPLSTTAALTPVPSLTVSPTPVPPVATEAISSANSLPAALDYSEAMMPVRDMGSEGSILGFAVASALEYQIQKALGKPIILSPRDIYYEARLQGGSSTDEDTGATIHDAIAVLSEKGTVAEDAWPYTAGEYNMKPPAGIEQAAHYKIVQSQAVHNTNELKEALKQHGPVVGGLTIFRDVYDTSVANTGILWTPGLNDKAVGGAAVCFVGYDDANERFKFKFSWGQGWGDRGYGYVPYEYVDKYLSDAWAILEISSSQTNPGDGAAYILIPAGEFRMGSPDSDPEALPAEKPQNTLSLEGFWLMKTEVTNAQYARCVAANACTLPGGNTWKTNDAADHPVANVTWHQANEYAKWVGGRLPTEAEWEKACRGDDGRPYPWGNEPPTETRLNFTTSSTRVVGSYPDGKSPYGILDMAGNVLEWTSSLWGKAPSTPDFKYPYNPGDGRENPGAPDDVRRVIRGGSYYDSNERSVSCTVRVGSNPGKGTDQIGFRVAMSP